jgi:phospholipase C
MTNDDQIQHVVVLMLENRSFDHMLGCLQGELNIDGIDPKAPRSNVLNGTTYCQLPGASRVLNDDPKHEHVNVMAQFGVNGGSPMSGFVADYAHSYPHASNRWGEVMKYFDRDSLPTIHALARSFTVCDRWFSSLPGPTWPNRFFAHSGTSLGRVTMPEGLFNLHLHWYNQTTIYDRLNDANVSWHIYRGDIPQSLLLVHQLLPTNLARYRPMRDFYSDAAGDPAKFPAFSFIEPEYTSPGENDEHPPHDVLNGDRLIANVYNAIRHNDALWQSTLLIVVWDEHGGFYDHVEPPKAVAPDHHVEEYTFDQYGVRVPAVLVSRFTPKGTCSTVFDHTSILRFALDRWKLAPLGARTAQANSIAMAFVDAQESAKSLTELHVTADAAAPSITMHSAQDLNANQRGLVAYSQYLATLVPGEDPARATERAAFMTTSSQAQTDTANDHVDRLLKSAPSANDSR